MPDNGLAHPVMAMLCRSSIMATAQQLQDDDQYMAMMDKDCFVIAVARIPKQSQENVDAAYAVMVDGIKPGDAAKKFGANANSLSRAMARIAEEWEQLCAEKGLVNLHVAVRQSFADLLLKMQAEDLAPLLRDAQASIAKQKAKKIKKKTAARKKKPPVATR
jgi:hypothetical protein